MTKKHEERSTFKYYCFEWGVHMLPQSCKISHNQCVNIFQFLFIVNQRYQVPGLRYIDRGDEVSRLVRGRKVLGNMKYLMSSVE